MHIETHPDNRRLRRLAMLRLVNHCIRVGKTRTSGPVFYLVDVDHGRDLFTSRNVHSDVADRLSLSDLASGIDEGIIHVSKVPGVIFHA